MPSRTSPPSRRAGRRIPLGLALSLALLSGGCQQGARTPVSLQLAISTGEGADEVSRLGLRRLATQVANDYMRNHPEVLLHLRYLPEADLVESVRERAQLGAGPDLLISRVAPVEILERQGYLQPVDISPGQLDPLRLRYLSEFRDGGSYEALPFLLQPTIACYDRRRVATAPATITDLVNRAAGGVKVGLPLQLHELLWTASAFDADQPLLNLFPTRVQARGTFRGLSSGERASVAAWLTWLYRSNVLPNVQFVDTSEELVARLETRQLDWIPCNSSALARLQRSLGPHLGVSVLPAGPDGTPARPKARLQLLSFSRDSTPAQRRVAKSFALFVLNDFSQNNLMVKAFGNMPVNQNVVVPVKESPALAAMEASLEHSTVDNFREGVGMRHAVAPLRHILKQVVYGEEKPAVGLQQLEAVAQESFLEDMARTRTTVSSEEVR